MPTDDPQPRPKVTARQILKALSEVQRRGAWPLLQQLESAEPDLAEFVLEQLSSIHQTLFKTGARPKAVRRLQRQVQALALVCVLALQADGTSGDGTEHSPLTEREEP